MGVLVICCYKPKAGAEAALDALVARHVTLLRREGLATDRPGLVMRAKDGTRLEIFEWASEEAGRTAHDNKAVAALWAEFATVSSFVPLAGLEEAQRPFAHFGAMAT